jgi:hypothetical protein
VVVDPASPFSAYEAEDEASVETGHLGTYGPKLHLIVSRHAINPGCGSHDSESHPVDS